MTNDEVMAESRRLVFFMAALFFAVFAAYIALGRWNQPGGRLAALIMAALASIFVAGGISRSFSVRVVLISLGMAGMLLVLLAERGFALVVFVFVAICAGQLYRMIKYHGVEEEPFVLGSDSPPARLKLRTDYPWKMLLLIPVALLVIWLLDAWVEHLRADWAREGTQRPSSGQGKSAPPAQRQMR